MNKIEKDRVINLPPMSVVATEPFQRRLAMTLRNLPEAASRRVLRTDVQMRILRFKGKIVMANGYPYPRRDLDIVLGHESARQISMFLEMRDGKPRYKPSTMTYPRLLALYCWVAIRWPYLAEHIVK
ncbi:MAG: hypothetical protein ABW157_13540 [Candidatus Thiodiazotropha sp. LLP2]